MYDRTHTVEINADNIFFFSLKGRYRAYNCNSEEKVTSPLGSECKIFAREKIIVNIYQTLPHRGEGEHTEQFLLTFAQLIKTNRIVEIAFARRYMPCRVALTTKDDSQNELYEDTSSVYVNCAVFVMANRQTRIVLKVFSPHYGLKGHKKILRDSFRSRLS